MIHSSAESPKTTTEAALATIGTWRVMLIDDAATVPVSSGGPIAVTHCPTARPDLSMATVLVNAVVAAVTTARVVLELFTCTTNPVPLTDAILPEMAVPRPRPVPARTSRAGQVPPPVAGLISTDVAVSSPAGVSAGGTGPVANAQSPTTRSAAVAVTVSVKPVEGVNVTRTWPVRGFCTWMSVAVTAATVPAVPRGGELLCVAGSAALALEGLPLAVEGLPQALTATAITTAATLAATNKAREPATRLFMVPHSLRSASMGASRAARLAG